MATLAHKWIWNKIGYSGLFLMNLIPLRENCLCWQTSVLKQIAEFHKTFSYSLLGFAYITIYFMDFNVRNVITYIIPPGLGDSWSSLWNCVPSEMITRWKRGWGFKTNVLKMGLRTSVRVFWEREVLNFKNVSFLWLITTRPSSIMILRRTLERILFMSVYRKSQTVCICLRKHCVRQESLLWKD